MKSPRLIKLERRYKAVRIALSVSNIAMLFGIAADAILCITLVFVWYLGPRWLVDVLIWMMFGVSLVAIVGDVVGWIMQEQAKKLRRLVDLVAWFDSGLGQVVNYGPSSIVGVKSVSDLTERERKDLKDSLFTGKVRDERITEDDYDDYD